MIDIPPTLPARAYLMAYDQVRGRLTGWSNLAYVLRGAALADLLLSGHLTEIKGKPQVDATARPPADPVLAGVLDDIARSRPRSWQHWVGRHCGPTRRAVAEQLAADGWIELRQRRVLGIAVSPAVTVRRPRAVTAIADRVRRALSWTVPVSKVDRHDAVLVSLAWAGELATVLPRAARKQHKDRIAALTDLAGPVGPAVRKVIQLVNSSYAGA